MRRKKIAHMVPLWMDQPFIGLIHQIPGDPPLDLLPEENQSLDLAPGLLKASCGLQTDNSTTIWPIEEVIMKFVSRKDGAQETLKKTQVIKRVRGAFNEEDSGGRAT